MNQQDLKTQQPVDGLINQRKKKSLQDESKESHLKRVTFLHGETLCDLLVKAVYASSFYYVF